MQTIRIGALTCQCARVADVPQTCYILLPQPVVVPPGDDRVMALDIDGLAARYGYNIVVVSGMNWEDDLTPWPAPSLRRGGRDFGGGSNEFLLRLRTEVVPAIETELGLPQTGRRLLMGISLSALFALWAWMNCSDFDDVACLSASFWYDGFPSWLAQQVASRPCKTMLRPHGTVYFSLGDQEAASRNPRFASVGKATDDVVESLRRAGVCVTYEQTAGTHFAPIAPRIEKALWSFTKR